MAAFALLPYSYEHAALRHFPKVPSIKIITFYESNSQINQSLGTVLKRRNDRNGIVTLKSLNSAGARRQRKISLQINQVCKSPCNDSVVIFTASS
jgi:hypothetical protein